MKEDGKREPVRARVFHVTDDHLTQLVAYLIGRTATAEVISLTHATEAAGGAA